MKNFQAVVTEGGGAYVAEREVSRDSTPATTRLEVTSVSELSVEVNINGERVKLGWGQNQHRDGLFVSASKRVLPGDVTAAGLSLSATGLIAPEASYETIRKDWLNQDEILAASRAKRKADAEKKEAEAKAKQADDS